MVVEPFEKWALDFKGTINPPSWKDSYILVCTDYITKWMEEIPSQNPRKKLWYNFSIGKSFSILG